MISYSCVTTQFNLSTSGSNNYKVQTDMNPSLKSYP